jgi:hypothetical protein
MRRKKGSGRKVQGKTLSGWPIVLGSKCGGYFRNNFLSNLYFRNEFLKQLVSICH